MDPIIAFCGINCSECQAYIATQANDQAAQEEILAKWRVEFNAPEMTLVDVTCDGCTTPGGRHGGYCAACPVRACGEQHAVENCGLCAEYATCQTVQGFIAQVPAAKERLDLIHSRN